MLLKLHHSLLCQQQTDYITNRLDELIISPHIKVEFPHMSLHNFRAHREVLAWEILLFRPIGVTFCRIRLSSPLERGKSRLLGKGVFLWRIWYHELLLNLESYSHYCNILSMTDCSDRTHAYFVHVLYQNQF